MDSQNQTTGQGQSMREMQKQVNKRTNTDGQPVPQPRLANQERPKSPEMMSTAANTAKSAAKKWAMGIGASMLIGGSAAATYYFLF